MSVSKTRVSPIRAVMGFTEGSFCPTSFAATAEASAPQRRGFNLGLQQGNFWDTTKPLPTPTSPNLPVDPDSAIGHDAINAPGKDGTPPLHFAVIPQRSGELIEILLSGGADLQAIDRLGRMALHVAIENERATFYVEWPKGRRIDLIVGQGLGKTYLKTEADGESPDTLLQLPDCA